MGQKINLEKLNEEMSMSSMDLASARTLILAFLTNSDDDATADFAEHNLKTLELSGKIESFLHIVECGHEFAKIYDFDDREIVPIREKFEEADELTWSKFEQLMDSSCGLNFDVQAISLFLAIVNQIRVPSDEIDDLLDLAAWYGSTRISPFVTSQGGWRCFRKMIKIQPEPSSSASNLAQIDQSITMSQFERTIQEVEMGSMVVLNDASDMIESNSTLTGSKTPEMMDSNIQTEDVDENPEENSEGQPEDEENEEIDTNQEIKSDMDEEPALDREDLASNEDCSNERTESISSSVFNDQEAQVEVHSSSSDRLSSSPVLITPPDTGTPVYISSQPESIDFDQESNSSFDASLINELMTNCQNNPPVDMSSSEDIEEQGFNIDRSDTMRTLKPSASIPIRSHTRDSLQEDFSPRYSYPEGSVGDSQDGIMLRAAATSGVQQLDADSVSERLKEELEADDHATEGDDEDESFSEEKENNRPKEIQNKPKNKIPFMEKQLHTSNIVEYVKRVNIPEHLKRFSHDISAENMAKQTNYFLLAGAAVVGLAAVYLKTAR